MNALQLFLFVLYPFQIPSGYGGSIVYLETIRDVAAEEGLPPDELEQDTVVHEIGHNFPDTPDGPGHTIERLGLYTDEIIDAIRSAKAPKPIPLD